MSDTSSDSSDSGDERKEAATGKGEQIEIVEEEAGGEEVEKTKDEDSGKDEENGKNEKSGKDEDSGKEEDSGTDDDQDSSPPKQVSSLVSKVVNKVKDVSPGAEQREERSKSRERRSYSRSRSRDRSPSPGEKRRKRNRDRSPIERRDKSGERRSSSPARGRRDAKSSTPDKATSPAKEKAAPAASKRKDDLLTTKTGGAYIPPAKLRMMQQNITDKGSEAYQRLAWEALKKSVNGLINKVNSPNIAVIVRELFAENIVRGRGLLCQSVIQAQTASPTFTHVYAALAAIINTKFPNIGELMLKRLILNFKRGFKRNDKTRCTSSVRFIGHMVNQQVAHEVLALEILTLLLENPTDDSAEVAITFLKEVGQKLSEVSPRGIHAIFERLRHVLHESTLDKRTQYMIEVMFQVRKDGFKDNPSIPEELDLVEEDDQFTHMITLDDATGGEEILNVFKHDADYVENEDKYGAIKSELLEEDSGASSGSGSGSDSDSDSDEEAAKATPIVDATETNLIALRRTIYLTIQSALDFEEAVHKLLKLNIKPGQEGELCHMIIDCCAQQRTYEKFFGLMGQRFCQVTRTYQEPFSKIFLDTYNTVHRLETGKLRNVAKFYSHLFYTDAIGWDVLCVIKLNEDDTTSSSRIFIKILFQELAEFMGLAKLVDRTRDGSMAEAWEGLLPRDNPRDTRFAINFFTSIGLGGLTEDLRSHLKTAPKPTAVVAPMVRGGQESSDSSSDSSTDSEEERRRVKKKEKKRARKEGEKRRKKRERSESEDEESDGEKRRRKKKSNKEDDNKRSKKDNEREKRRGGSDEPEVIIGRGRRQNGQRDRRDRSNESEEETQRRVRRGSQERRPRVKSEAESEEDTRKEVREKRRDRDGSVGRERRGRDRDVDVKIERVLDIPRREKYDRDGERRGGGRDRSRSQENRGRQERERRNRDRSLSTEKRSRNDRDRSVSQEEGTKDKFGRDVSVSPRNGRDRSLSPGMKRRDGREKSVSPAMKRRGGRDKSVSPEMKRRGGRDGSVSPEMKRRGGRDRSVSPEMKGDRRERDRSQSGDRRRQKYDRHGSVSPPRRR
eukprot:GFUD01082237.1.p1 GENE.GFUD01082237.1~~GFUD01082237.1.p1  ORF type:complete len:1070 (+),score=390.09 GFUD01082237.1:55-3264(+)